MLEGNIRRQLIRLAFPLLIGNVLQQLYNTVDSLMIGKFLGTEAFSAVGIAGTVMNLFIFVLSGFCTGLAVLFGQMYGKGDRSGFRREVFVALTLGTGITVALSALFMALMRPVLLLIHSPVELLPYIESYLSVIIGGMLCTYFYNLCSCMLNSIGDTRAATFFLFISVVMNIALDYLFVGPLDWGTGGAAWATVLSQLFSALCCLAYILRRDRDLICTRADFQLEGSLVRRTLMFGFGSALHMSSLYIGKILVQGAVNTLGTQGIAAYTATMRIEGFANSFGTSHGQATSVFLSQNYGAKNRERVRRGFGTAMRLAVGMGVALSVVLYGIARPGVKLFIGAQDAQALRFGVDYLRQVALFYVLCFTGNTFVGFFRGIGHVYAPVTATALHISVRVLLSYLLVGGMGLRAVALGTGVGWVVMSVYQVAVALWLKRSGRIWPDAGA